MDWSPAVSGVDAVVHLAAQVHQIDQSDDPLSEYHRVNLDGTKRLRWLPPRLALSGWSLKFHCKCMENLRRVNRSRKMIILPC